MSHKTFFIITLSLTISILIALSGLTVIVDPFFHYHAPLNGLQYPMDSGQRYQNDGILRNFDYDSIIIGTSMTENFHASQWDELFDAKTVKVPLQGSLLKETADHLDQAFASNNKIKYVVRSLDFYSFWAEKDAISDFDYPTYLYDNNVFNDVKYVLNKAVLFNKTVGALSYTGKGEKTLNFDDLYNWSDLHFYGKQYVLERYTRSEKLKDVTANFDDIKQNLKENIDQNVIRLAVEHPETEFYLFFPPYSIVSWDSWNQDGCLLRNIEMLRYVSNLLIGYDNIHLYSFNDDFELICNLNNYKDLEHYGKWVNQDILRNMKNEKGLLTLENLDIHYDSLIEFYSNYNYDAIFEQ